LILEGGAMTRGWERLAGHEGGTVVALASAPVADGGAILFAATAAGLFRSRDGARGWSAAGHAPLPLLSAVAPSARFAENGRMFAGTQTGFYRSNDAGRSWQHTLSGARVLAIAVVPGDGREERLFIGTDRDGILRSDDGGQTWTGANPGLLDLTVLALAFSPDAARDRTGFAATASGLYRTRNGGQSWRAVELPLDEPAVQCLALSPFFARDRLVLAGTESDGLWRSDDGGTTWEPVPGLSPGRIDALAFSTRIADTRLVAAATAGGVALSRDGGATWQLTGEASPPALALAFVPDGAGETLVAGLYRGGIARLPLGDGGGDWMPSNAGLTATFLSTLVASPSFAIDRTLFTAGPDAGVRVSRDGGRAWADAGLGDAAVYGLAIAPEDSGGSLIFAATDAGLRRSRDGKNWAGPTPGGESPAGMVAAGPRAQVFAATLDGHLIASDDGGKKWRALATPFDGAAVVSLAHAPDGTLYVGTMQSGAAGTVLWRSAGGGATWVRWLEERGGASTLPLAVPTDGDGGPFVALGGRVLRPRRNASQTRRGARSPLWGGVSLVADGGNPVAITALAVSPHYRADGMLFVATSAGVYRSSDRGRTFDRWNDGLGDAPILALATARADDAPIVFALGVDGTIWRRAGDG
jgi:photosystem II stability/assembly factor-like uncharacterized protein